MTDDNLRSSFIGNFSQQLLFVSRYHNEVNVNNYIFDSGPNLIHKLTKTYETTIHYTT